MRTLTDYRDPGWLQAGSPGPQNAMKDKGKEAMESIGSTSSIQTVDGLKFHKFVMKMTLAPDKAIYMQTYSRLFDKKDMAINITYIDKKIGKQMRDAFINSKFRK